MFRYFIVIFLFCNVLQAQQIISGVIKDEKTLNPIPFASIGMSGKHFGTLSNEKGEFELNTPWFVDLDTLKITAVGYETISFNKNDVKGIKNKILVLKPMVYDLKEVNVKPLKVHTKILGTDDYSTKNCTAFMGENENWKGEQAAIKAGNKEGQTVYIEEFKFYIIKNDYPDSIKFRIMFYEVGEKGYPSKTFLKKPIIFKTKVKQGEVKIDLKDYNVSTVGDFFISLECLEEKMEATKFCFAGSTGTPSFYKVSAFGRWGRVRGGGGDFNVKVSYVK